MTGEAPSDLLTIEDAARLLGVDAEQAEAMVAQELLVPTDDLDGERRFTRAAVEAVRLAGG